MKSILFFIFAAFVLLQANYAPQMAIRHSIACGPKAINEALEHYDYTDKSNKEISQDILKHGGIHNLGRTLASLVDNNALDITFPKELTAALQRHDFKVQVIQGSHEDLEETIKQIVNDDKIGIVLIKNKEKVLKYHYKMFRTIKDTRVAYGDETIYINIYILDR